MGIFKNSKLSDNLKIFKKSGKDVYCANCGTRTGAITREWLLDDKCLCVNCQNALPKYYKNNYGTLTFEVYNKMFTYMSGESKELGKQFKKKHAFLDLQLDAANGILRYKPSHAVPLYVKLENIADFSLVCHPRSIEDDFGVITLTLECINPNIFMHEDLELTGLENDCYKFMEYYYSIRNMREGQGYIRGDEDGTKSEYKTPVNNVADDAQLQKALAMFMFDSINDVTAENLKAQRNRLIKSFHPDANSDEDTRYAQKINEAYELLHKYVK